MRRYKRVWYACAIRYTETKNVNMTVSQFQRWLESRIQFAEWLDEYGNPEDHVYAQGFIEEAYHYAVSLRLPECAEVCKPGPVIVRMFERDT